MAVKSRLIILVKKPDAVRKFEEGDIVGVAPADYVPSPETAYKFLIIDSEKTVEENQYLLKGGVPDDVIDVWKEEDERVRTAIVAAINAGRQQGKTDAEIMVGIKKDIVFDPAKDFKYTDYPKQAYKIDMTVVPQETIDRINAGHSKLAEVKSNSKQKAHDKVMEKYAEHKGRELTTEELDKKTLDIVNEYTASTEEVAAGLNKTKDELKDEILKASLLGREEIEHTSLADLAKPEPFIMTKAEQDSIIINKHG